MAFRPTPGFPGGGFGYLHCDTDSMAGWGPYPFSRLSHLDLSAAAAIFLFLISLKQVASHEVLTIPPVPYPQEADPTGPRVAPGRRSARLPFMWPRKLGKQTAGFAY